MASSVPPTSSLGAIQIVTPAPNAPYWADVVERELSLSTSLGISIDELVLCWNGVVPASISLEGVSRNLEGDQFSHTFSLDNVANAGQLSLLGANTNDNAVSSARLVWTPSEIVPDEIEAVVLEATVAFVRCTMAVSSSMAGGIIDAFDIPRQVAATTPFADLTTFSDGVRLHLIVSVDSIGAQRLYLFATTR